MLIESRRRILLPDGSIIVESQEVDTFLDQAATPIQPNAAEKIRNFHRNSPLTPEQFMAATVIASLGTLQFKFGNEWVNISPIIKVPDLEIYYSPKTSSEHTKNGWGRLTAPTKSFDFVVDNGQGPVTIRVLTDSTFSDLSHNLDVATSALRETTIEDNERRYLEERKEYILLKLKEYAIQKLAGDSIISEME